MCVAIVDLCVVLACLFVALVYTRTARTSLCVTCIELCEECVCLCVSLEDPLDANCNFYHGSHTFRFAVIHCLLISHVYFWTLHSQLGKINEFQRNKYTLYSNYQAKYGLKSNFLCCFDFDIRRGRDVVAQLRLD